jgi:hypothetical protein
MLAIKLKEQIDRIEANSMIGVLMNFPPERSVAAGRSKCGSSGFFGDECSRKAS